MTSDRLSQLLKTVSLAVDPDKAQILQRFFKTNPGEYGSGDRFLGLIVPIQRKIVKNFSDLNLEDLEYLLTSPIHEHRLIALLILVKQFSKADAKSQKEIYHFYLNHTHRINNWDLVDLSAPHIIGKYLATRDQAVLIKLAKSPLLWERRIAIISTFFFLRQGNPLPTFRIATLLLSDRHDLIHKATGWMLRELGKRCSQAELLHFLDKYAQNMPRTMLRYSIERFEPALRQHYLGIKYTPPVYAAKSHHRLSRPNR